MAFASTAALADGPAPAVPPTQADMQAAFVSTLRRLGEMLSKTPDIVVADVSGHAITRGDVAEALANLPPSGGRLTLEGAYHDAVKGLILQQALAIHPREAGIDKDPAIQRRIATYADALLANEYLSRTAGATVTDAMAHELYDRSVATQPGPEAVHARVIMVFTEQQAQDVMAALANGMDFAEAAVRFSRDATAQAGGDLGFVRLGTVLPELGAVIFALAPGQTSSYPIRAGGGLYLLKVEARRREPPPPFDNVRSGLIQQLSRNAVPGVIENAFNGLDVHDYGITGKGATSDSAAPSAAR